MRGGGWVKVGVVFLLQSQINSANRHFAFRHEVTEPNPSAHPTHDYTVYLQIGHSPTPNLNILSHICRSTAMDFFLLFVVMEPIVGSVILHVTAIISVETFHTKMKIIKSLQ